LIDDAQSGSADFTLILVYDVSRWGRFQDVDESAYYEHLCKRAGINVRYCAESFENDGSPISSLVKTLKRAMAAEYSRELSVRVFGGQSRVIKLGFTLGGIAGYGFRRQLVDQAGAPKCLLAPGEWKSIATDRVLLVPGPAEEIETVREIYSSFALEGKNESEIAKALNQRGVPHHLGNAWTAVSIRDMLRSEKYIGNHIWNRKSSRLVRKTVLNSPERWVRVEGAFQGIVERPLFESARAIFRARAQYTYRGRPRGLSDAEMIKRLARVFRAHGRLSHHIIDHSEGVPSCGAYAVRFGQLARAYDLVGFKKDANQYGRGIEDRRLEKEPRGLCDDDMLDALRRLLRERGYLSRTVIDACKNVPSTHTYSAHFGT
jgi:DNA invertase Pin-like site-specific DNA recombinase